MALPGNPWADASRQEHQRFSFVISDIYCEPSFCPWKRYSGKLHGFVGRCRWTKSGKSHPAEKGKSPIAAKHILSRGPRLLWRWSRAYEHITHIAGPSTMARQRAWRNDGKAMRRVVAVSAPRDRSHRRNRRHSRPRRRAACDRRVRRSCDRASGVRDPCP